ncbi:MAG TPA: ABC transporter substrate-binding protein, partial [Firmicutes bacterium]|nr:ABC transporter substrate-binding protein [Bacillota bacterium]
KDFSAQLLAFKNAGVQAIIAYSAPVEVGVFLRQAKQLIPEVKIFQSSVGATQTSMEVAGDAANGTYAVVTYTEDNPDPKVQEFIAAHKKRWNDIPYDFFDPLAYDAVYMLAEAIRIAGSTDRTAVRDAFFTIKGFRGATGLEYNVMPNGETINELILVEIVDGKHRVVQRVKG